jgi:uncharacterized membrane protein YccF (DUF307 family)
VLWIVFGGFFSWLGYLLAGLLLCLTVVGIPFGLQAFKIGFAVLAPFGKQVVERPHANSLLHIVLNLLWLVFAGWEIAVAHIVSAIVCAISIIGIPFAVQHLKLVPLALFPFGRDLE